MTRNGHSMMSMHATLNTDVTMWTIVVINFDIKRHLYTIFWKNLIFYQRKSMGISIVSTQSKC